MLRAEIHPTKRALLESALTIIETHGVDNVTVEMVLRDSEVSKGSLYHHFKDFDSLLAVVQLHKYSEFVDEAIRFFEQAFNKAFGPEEFKTNLFSVMALGHDPAGAPRRIQRARVVGSWGSNPDFTQGLAREQERLRQRGQDLIAAAQMKGWVNSSLSARALSSFIVGFTFGRVLDDVCADHADPTEWNAVVREFLDRVLLEPSC